MKLVDSYLREVAFFLPKSNRQDILAELSDDIRSQVDERQHELGRQLDEVEAEEILKRWGKPLLVAERYLPQRYLIGPVLYPIYTWVLKIVALVYLLPWLLVWAGLTLFSPAYRGDDPSARFSALWSWWGILLNGFFFVTVAFAYMERFTLPAWLAQGWDPRKLPAQSDPDQIPLASSILDMTVNALFAGWWLKLGFSAEIWTGHGGDGEITLAPVWQTLYWPILLLFLAGSALAIFNIIRPRRTQTHAALRLARSAYCMILIVILVSVAALLELTATGDKSPADLTHAATWLNRSLRFTLAIIGIACVVDLYRNARRLLHGRRTMSAVAALFVVALLAIPSIGSRAADTHDHFFESNGVKIRYVVEGQGETVVLIHGFTANAEMWNQIRPELAKSYRVAALDCRGHGKSDKPHDPKQHGRETIEDVVRLLDRLQIKRAYIVGYSMGAEIAGNLLVLHPDRLQSVTLGGGGPSSSRPRSRAREERSRPLPSKPARESAR